ncbi:hypothetical protein ElyMa_001742200 [Elysia marginata]|uniref:Uncharacterized protein n=1 Tax=Elysia marginata TaxID=1093978 RepID=A0AAV4E992_9GAST|nr:hypothetical protein ElyMa_001742200 [Elysia marginata]
MDLVNSAENFRCYAEDDTSEMSRDQDRSWMIKRDNVLLLPRDECKIQKRVYVGMHTASIHPGKQAATILQLDVWKLTPP